MQTLRIVSLVILAVGIMMLAVSFFRSPEDAMRSAWKEEDAKQRSQASLELNQVVHQLEHPKNLAQRKALEEKLEAAQAKYDQIDARLASTLARQERLHAILKWTGFALVLLGGILYWPTKEG